ncbi:hypothetical protein FRC17_003572 [Serendipita sp. 399]|nr:hypothetical protein FRC17_003572 [Serendipita sp. 399]
MPPVYRVPVQDNSLYLFIRGNPTIPDHHGLYIHQYGNSGKEFHARNIGFGWVKEIGVTHGFPETMAMILLLRLGSISEERIPSFELVVDRIAVRPHDPTFNCIVWVREAIEVLIKEGFITLRDEKDVNDILEEARLSSRAMRDSVMDGTQQPQAIDSQVVLI